MATQNNGSICGLTKHKRGAWYRRVDGKLHFIVGKKATVREADQVFCIRMARGDFNAPTAPRSTNYDLLEARSMISPPATTVQAQPVPYPGAQLTQVVGSSDQLITAPQSVAGIADLTIAELVQKFLAYKHRKLKAGMLSGGAYRSTQEVMLRFEKHHGRDRVSKLISVLTSYRLDGLRTQDGKPYKSNTLDRHVTQIRHLVRWAETMDLLPGGLTFAKVVGQAEFQKPAPKDKRGDKLAKEESQGKKFFTRGEVQKLLAKASPQMRAMIYLGLNCGFTNVDCANLPLAVVERSINSGFLDMYRRKTNNPRRAPLWPETVAALRDAMAIRPAGRSAELNKLMFLTPTGLAVVRSSSAQPDDAGHKFSQNDFVGIWFKELREQAGFRTSDWRGFSVLRHTFRTVAAAVKDLTSVNLIMGHSQKSLGEATYVHHVEDEQLLAVTNYVRQRLIL